MEIEAENRLGSVRVDIYGTGYIRNSLDVINLLNII